MDTRPQKLLRLFQAAHRHVWLVDNDIVWPPSPVRPCLPMTLSATSLQGYREFDALPVSRQQELCWEVFTSMLSDIYHGEVAAMTLAAQLLAMAQDHQEKLSLSAQVFEEARHADFFQQFFQKFGIRPQPASPALQQLLQDAVASELRTEKLLVCQIIIENLAMVRFQQLQAQTLIPALQQGLQKIMTDEARHVSLGPLLLRDTLEKESVEQHRDYRRFVANAMQSITTDFSSYYSIAAREDWSLPAMRCHLRENRIQQKTLAENLQRRLSQAFTSAGLNA